MNKLDFKKWSAELDKVSYLTTDEECYKFYELLDFLNGNEEERFLRKLIDIIILDDDFGLYEGLYTTIWSFPSNMVGRILAQKLPNLQKRMGTYDQVFRFYIPIPTNATALEQFISESNNWTEADRKIAISAIKEWNAQDKDWEIVLEKLGETTPHYQEALLPNEWCEEWKNRVRKWRDFESSEDRPYELFWNGGKNQWLDDLDFLLEFLTLNHGKHWREIDVLTNPLWFYAKTITFKPFVTKLKQIPTEKQIRILENIKKVNKGKYQQLKDEIGI